MRVVSAVGGATVLDLNAPAGGGILNATGDKQLAVTTLTDDAISDPRAWWTPLTTPSDVATREISIPLKVQGTSYDDVAARVAALNAAVDTPFVLEVRRHGASTSGFLRCFPCAPQVSAVINAAGSAPFADVALRTRTEPYALGVMVDTGNKTITQDPSVSTAFYTDVNGVAGDALTPALIRWNVAGLNPGVPTHLGLWGVRRRGVPSNLSGLVVQGEAASSTATSGANVTTSILTGDTAFAGNSALQIVYGAAATTSDWGEATWTFPMSGVEVPGTYRMIVRVARFAGAGGLEHQITPTVGAYQAQTYVLPAGGVEFRVVDLGLIDIPVGQPRAIAAPVSAAVYPATGPTVTLRFVKTGAAGAGTLRVDWVALVPADEDMFSWRIQQPSSGTPWAFADGYSMDSGFADADPATTPTANMLGTGVGVSTFADGGILRLAPGDNRIWCVQGFTGAQIWGKSVNVVPRFAYWPRYRWLP